MYCAIHMVFIVSLFLFFDCFYHKRAPRNKEACLHFSGLLFASPFSFSTCLQEFDSGGLRRGINKITNSVDFVIVFLNANCSPYCFSLIWFCGYHAGRHWLARTVSRYRFSALLAVAIIYCTKIIVSRNILYWFLSRQLFQHIKSVYPSLYY